MIPTAPARRSCGIRSRTVASAITLSTAHHSRAVEVRHRRRGDGGEQADHLLELADGHVHLEPDLRLGAQRAREQQSDLLDLLALPRVVPGGAVGDELRDRLEELADDAETVRADGRAGLGHLDDGVDQALGRPWPRWRPRRTRSARRCCARRTSACVYPTSSVAMRLPRRSSGRLHGRVAGHDQHPARRAEARLRVDQLLAPPRRRRRTRGPSRGR